MDQLPSGWTWATLGDLGKYQNGRAFSENEWGTRGRPIIRIQNLTGTSDSFNHFSGTVDERHIVRDGDLLVSWAATLGVFIWHGPEAALNQHIFKVSSFVDASFHRWAIEYALQELRTRSHGSGMVHVTKSVFDSVRIPLPPETQQRCIVEELERRLSHVEAAEVSLSASARKIVAARAALSQAAVTGRLSPLSMAETTARGYLSRLLDTVSSTGTPARWRTTTLSEVPAVPRHWECVTLGAISLDAAYGTSAKAVSECTETPVVRIPNVKPGRVNLEDLKYLPNRSISRENLLLPNDLLFIRSNGSRDLIGLAALAGPAAGMAFASYLIRFRVVPDPTLLRWVEMVVGGPAARRLLIERSSSSAGQNNLSIPDIASLPIPIPPRDEMTAILVEYQQRGSILDTVYRSIETSRLRCRTVRSAVLAAAFAGRLVDSKFTDEPVTPLAKKNSALAKEIAQKRDRRARKKDAA